MSRFAGAALGARTRALREAHGMTLTELADGCELSKGYLSTIEADAGANPTLDVLTKIATVLDVTVGDLVGQPKHQERMTGLLKLRVNGQIFVLRRDLERLRDATKEIESVLSDAERSGTLRDLRPARTLASTVYEISTKLASLEALLLTPQHVAADTPSPPVQADAAQPRSDT